MEEVTLLKTKTTTKNLLPAKSGLVVHVGSISSKVGTGCCEVEYSMFTGNADDWVTTRTTRSIDKAGAHVLNHESEIPVSINADLIDFLTNGEIEFSVFHHGNSMQDIGSTVIPLGSFLQGEAGISGVFPILAKSSGK